MRATVAKRLRRIAGQIVREKGIKSEGKWTHRFIKWMKRNAEGVKSDVHVSTTQFYSVKYTGYIPIYRNLKRQWKAGGFKKR